jgi:hypothetical protein
MGRVDTSNLPNHMLHNKTHKEKANWLTADQEVNGDYKNK